MPVVTTDYLQKSKDRLSRHNLIHETIRRSFVTPGVPSILEAVGLTRDDEKKAA